VCHPTLSLASPLSVTPFPSVHRFTPSGDVMSKRKTFVGYRGGRSKGKAGMSKHERESETRDQNFGNERH
jgi:hypothetical protein